LVSASEKLNKFNNNSVIASDFSVIASDFSVIASVSEAIFGKSKQYFYEITSVVSLPRNDETTRHCEALAEAISCKSCQRLPRRYAPHKDILFSLGLPQKFFKFSRKDETTGFRLPRSLHSLAMTNEKSNVGWGFYPNSALNSNNRKCGALS